MCPVCRKSYTHSKNLKAHIIKNHNSTDLLKNNIDPNVIVRDMKTKKNVEEEKRTDLQAIKDTQKMLSGSKIN